MRTPPIVPAVSVIVTSFNVEAYLAECLDSLLAQTLRDLEIIVVDDGSTDSSPEIVKRYAARDPRIRPVLLPDNSPGAVGTPSNTGLELATAPYVGFADGDDVLAPTMFEELHRAALTHDTDLAMCQYEELVEPGGERRAPADARRWEQLEEGHLELDVETRKQILRFVAVPWRKLYRRQLLEDHRIRFPVGDHFFEDNPFHWFTVVSADSIAIVPRVLCAHRVGRPGQTIGADDARLRQMFQHYWTIEAWLRERGLERVYRTTLLSWAISQMEWITVRTSPDGQRDLFDVLVPILAPHSRRTVDAALAEGGKGVRGRHLAHAVRTQDFAAFIGEPGASAPARSLLAKTSHHLRTSGVRHTAGVAARYLSQRASSVRLRGRPLVRPRAARPGLEDVLFALAVLEQRLERIERRLADRQSPTAAPRDRDGSAT